MMHWGDYGWGMGFGWLFMVLFWALVILGVVYIFKMVSERSRPAEKGETALDILKKRYAKGEITKEEFERMKDDLAKS
jgi:putative membrane protein